MPNPDDSVWTPVATEYHKWCYEKMASLHNEIATLNSKTRETVNRAVGQALLDSFRKLLEIERKIQEETSE